MTKTIIVTQGNPKKNEWKVLVNYIQRGITYHSVRMANRDAKVISENEPCDHLILAQE